MAGGRHAGVDTANERVLTEVGDGLIGQRMIHDSRIMAPDSCARS